MPKLFIRSFSLILMLLLAACQTNTSTQDWPSDIPNRKIFVDGFMQKRGIETVDEKIINEHLIWIVRFYQGTVIYPNGWNRVSSMFLDSIESPKARALMSHRLKELGVEIANEWAQDNGIRLIDNNAVATWGSALRTAAEQNDQSNFVSKVEDDVAALIKGALTTKEINYERYYPEEDYDSF